ncbi:MAG: hypothetical protein KAS32_07175 [Candidatus Peribacteraceae bacterium]|nr:hypothetical protein [Candidatus Peribacteraceae bacterium]
MSILNKAIDITSNTRPEDYGHPLDDFTRAAEMISGLMGWKVKAEEVPLIMICIKLSRQKNKHKEDNLIDIAGYAETIDKVLNERAQRGHITSGFGYFNNIK